MTERVQGPESRPGDPESGWVRMMVRATLPFIMHKFHHINDNISGTIIICFRWIAFQCMLFYVFIQMSFDIFFGHLKVTIVIWPCQISFTAVKCVF